MPASHHGPFAVWTQALALWTCVAASQLALAQTIACNVAAPLKCNAVGGACGDQSGGLLNGTGSTGACPVAVGGLYSAGESTVARGAAAGTKTGLMLSLPQAEYVTGRDLGLLNAKGGTSLGSSAGCLAERTEFSAGDPINRPGAINVGAPLANDSTTELKKGVIGNNTIRDCQNGPYVLRDVRSPGIASDNLEKPRSGMTLPKVSNVREDNFIDHLRIVRDGQVNGREHHSLIWVERPQDKNADVESPTPLPNDQQSGSRADSSSPD